MVNKPKRAGTAAESAVAAFLVRNGWPYAERRSLSGALDKGDIAGTPGLCWEVKSCSGRPENISYAGFLRECETERIHAKAEFGIVVVKPRGRGVMSVDRWLTAMYERDMQRLTSRLPESMEAGAKVAILTMLDIEPTKRVVLRPRGCGEDLGAWHSFMLLREMVDLLRTEGYGDTRSTGTPLTGSSFVDGARSSTPSTPGAQP